MRMSKLRLAEYHYGKAAQIHPQNAVLLGCVGMVRREHVVWILRQILIGLFSALRLGSRATRRVDCRTEDVQCGGAAFSGERPRSLSSSENPYLYEKVQGS